MVGRSFDCDRRRLHAHRPQVLVLSAHSDTMADGNGDPFTVCAGPFGDIFVGVSEDGFNPRHVLNDTSLILGSESK